MSNQNEQLMTLVRLIVAGDTAAVRKTIQSSPDIVRSAAVIGASRQEAADYFFTEIRHYLYEGDTALHMAAAAFRSEIAQNLIDAGANCGAKNRRGAEPLHYAADGNTWNPDAQAAPSIASFAREPIPTLWTRAASLRSIALSEADPRPPSRPCSRAEPTFISGIRVDPPPSISRFKTQVRADPEHRKPSNNNERSSKYSSKTAQNLRTRTAKENPLSK